MQKALIGKKIGMTQIFDANGNVVPVTVVEAGPCSVVMKKTVENDGYEAVQLGFGDVKVQRVNKPMKGHFDKAGTAPKKSLREFRLDDQSSLNVGDILKADVFAVGDHVDVVGTSKGKGTAGAIKRWNFSRLKMTHGTGPNARHAGSLGACSDPSRVYKGKKLAGHLGWRPTVRGSVMNPNDHPHGGGEGKSPIGRPGPCTPWGKPALGYKTRNTKKASDKLIVKRRNGK